MTAAVSVDQVTVDSGGELDVDSGVTLTTANGTGTDLTDNGIVNVAGTLSVTAGSGTAAVVVGGAFNVAATGIVSGFPSSSSSHGHFGRLDVDRLGRDVLRQLPERVHHRPGRDGDPGRHGHPGLSDDLNGTVNASANVTIQGPSGVSNLQIGGTVTMTAGTLSVSRGNAGTMGQINSGGSLVLQGSSIFALGGNVTANYTVASGGTLDIEPGALVNGSSYLIVASGATLKVGSTDGIRHSLTIGNVRTSSTTPDSYSTAANYEYKGTAAQITGNALPTTVNNLTVSNTGGAVTPTSNLTTSGTLSVLPGASFEKIGAYTLTIGAGGVSNAGTIQLNGSTSACPETDNSLIRSTVPGTQRSWSGAGTFTLEDVDVQDQAGSAAITALSSTDSLNNGANWTITSSCAIITTPTTTAVVSSSPTPSTYGDSVTFTATVSPVPTGGSVTFIEGGTCASPTTVLAGPTAVDGSGQAAFSISTLTVPSHTIVACYGGTTGFDPSSGSVTQTVNQASSTTVVTCPASATYTGSAIEPCTVSVTGAGGLSLTPDPVYSANTNVGTAGAGYTYPGDANHTGSSDATTFEITKAASTVTVTVSDAVYDGSPHGGTATVTGAGGLSQAVPVKYVGRNGTVYPASNTAPTAAGDYIAQARYPGDANHGIGNDAVNFAITAASSTTVVTCPASATYTGSAIEPCTVSVTGAGGLSLTPDPVYSANTNVGTAGAGYTYPGDANHTGSSDATTFEITPLGVTVTPDAGQSKVYGDLDPVLTFTNDAGLLAGDFTGALGRAPGADVGLYPIDLGDLDAGPDYSLVLSAPAVDFEITAASSTTVVTCPASATYTGSAIEPCTVSVTGAGGLSLTPDPVYSANTNVGTAGAGYTYPGDANHTGSSDATTFEITKAASTVTVTVSDAVYDGSPHGGTATVTGAGGLSQAVPVKYVGRNGTVYPASNTAPTAAGDYIAQARYPGDANHGIGNDAVNFAITAASSTTVVTCPASATYTGSAIEPCTVSVTGAGGLSLTPDPVYSANTNVGTAGAGYTYPGDANHTGSSDATTFEITPLGVTVTPDAGQSKVYGDLDPVLTFTNDAGLLAGDFTGALGRAPGADVGLYPIDLGDLDAGPDYSLVLSAPAVDFEITAASSTTVVTCPASATYTGSAIEPCTVSVTGAGGLSLTPDPVYSANTNVGTAGAGYTYPGDANHTGSSDATTFEITPLGVTVTPDAGQSKVYGDLDPVLTFTNDAGLLAGDFTGALGRAPGADVGLYPIDLGDLDAGPDYSLVLSAPAVDFEITAASSTTVVTCPASATYTGSAIEPCTVSVTGAGGLSLAPDPVYSANTNVGTAGAGYTYPGDANHTGSSDATTFEITPKDLTITATDVSKTYGALYVFDTTTPSTNFSIVGLVIGESITSVALTSAGAATGATIAGSPYPITPSAATAGPGTVLGNYDIAYVDGELTVTAVGPPPPPAPETSVYVSVETAADGSGTVLPAQSLASGSSVTAYAITRNATGTFVGNLPATWTLTGVTGGVVGGDLVPSVDGRSATFTGHLAGTAKLRATDGPRAGESGIMTVVAGPVTPSPVYGLLADVAASDANLNRVDGFDARFAISGSSTTSAAGARLFATNPGMFHYELDLRNRTGVTMPMRGRPLPIVIRNGFVIAERTGGSTVVIITVPSLPASTGLASVPGSTADLGSPAWAQLPENSAFKAAGSRSVQAHPDDRSIDVNIVVSWAASAPGGDCLATSGITWISGQPTSGAFVKCVKVEGLEIPNNQVAHVHVDVAFGLTGSDGWAANAATAFRAGFPFTSQTRVTLDADFPIASLAGKTYVGNDVAGLSGAGERITAIGGFVFDQNGRGIANAKVRLYTTAPPAAKRCTAAGLVAETRTDANGVYFLWKRGANQSLAGAPGLLPGRRYYVAVCTVAGVRSAYWPARSIGHRLGIGELETQSFYVSRPTHLGFSIQPIANRLGRTMYPVQVALLDKWNNPVSDSTLTVRISIASGPGGTLSGTRTRTMVNGYATFSDLKISGGPLAAGVYTLRAVDASRRGAGHPFTRVISRGFNVTD